MYKSFLFFVFHLSGILQNKIFFRKRGIKDNVLCTGILIAILNWFQSEYGVKFRFSQHVIDSLFFQEQRCRAAVSDTPRSCLVQFHENKTQYPYPVYSGACRLKGANLIFIQICQIYVTYFIIYSIWHSSWRPVGNKHLFLVDTLTF